MSAIILDGKKIFQEIKDEIQLEVKNDFKGDVRPGLVTIIVGNNPASRIYVNSKAKACAEVGMYSEVIELSESTSENELLDLIRKLNEDSKFHGILVQQPLPHHIDTMKINETINPDKDVDGFHPINVGRLLLGEECFVPCTPAGIVELMNRYKIQVSGKHVVIIGRSNIVGKPLSALLIQKNKTLNATVTICHSGTKNIEEFTRIADIVITAMGSPFFLKENMVKENSVVIDVGINRIEDSSSSKGYKIVGDVDFENVSKKVNYITPVPGGIGPMTIAMLLKNVLFAAKRIEGIVNV